MQYIEYPDLQLFITHLIINKLQISNIDKFNQQKE